MPKFKAYVKVPADSTGKLKRIVTKTVSANSSTEALASLRGQYGANSVNITSKVMPKHKSRIKSSYSQKSYSVSKHKSTTKQNKFKLRPSIDSSPGVIDQLAETTFGKIILTIIFLPILFITIYTYSTMDDSIEVGVYDLTGDYVQRNEENLVSDTYKKIIMKDEMTKLDNKTSKYIDEFNKINSSLLCKVENISKEDCTFEVLRYAICNHEFNLIKYRYFISILKDVEKHTDWKTVRQDYSSMRYDWYFDVNVHFFITFNEQRNSTNYEFSCR